MKSVTDKGLADTGERMIPAHHKGHMVYGEHIVRYEAVKALVKGKTVLDIASGSGYGSQLIGTSAQKVYGVDIDKESVSYATKNYGSDNVTFLEGDGVSIPLEDNVVDVVVSFETIEHIEDYKTFMSEVKRVLKNDGLLILSTPNDIEFIEGNHFHIHEFERQELKKLVRGYFTNIEEYFQATWLYNALVAENQLTEEWRAPIETINTAPIDHKRAIYFFMLCANRKVAERVEPIAALSEHFSQRVVEQQANHTRTVEAKATELEQKLAAANAEIASQEEMIRAKDEAFLALHGELEAIHRSKTWKVAQKMSKVIRTVKKTN